MPFTLTHTQTRSLVPHVSADPPLTFSVFPETITPWHTKRVKVNVLQKDDRKKNTTGIRAEEHREHHRSVSATSPIFQSQMCHLPLSIC